MTSRHICVSTLTELSTWFILQVCWISQKWHTICHDWKKLVHSNPQSWWLGSVQPLTTSNRLIYPVSLTGFGLTCDMFYQHFPMGLHHGIDSPRNILSSSYFLDSSSMVSFEPGSRDQNSNVVNTLPHSVVVLVESLSVIYIS